MGRTNRVIDFDVVAVIEACAENGVAVFKCGDVEISFGEVWPKAPKASVANALTEVQSNGEVQELGDQDEANVRERQLDEMLIDDPLGYEKAQLEGK